MIDTGVVISAALKKDGTSRKAFLEVINHGKPLLALETILELEDVLGRPKLARFIAREDKINILTWLAQRGELIEITSDLTWCRDETDNKFLNLAVDGRADVLLTRDLDLLVLKSVERIPILNPSDFLAMQR